MQRAEHTEVELEKHKIQGALRESIESKTATEKLRGAIQASTSNSKQHIRQDDLRLQSETDTAQNASRSEHKHLNK